MKVLIVDGEINSLSLLNGLLTMLDLKEVHLARDGAEAIDKVMHNHFDYVFCNTNTKGICFTTFLAMTKIVRQETITTLISNKSYARKIASKPFYKVDYLLSDPFSIKSVMGILFKGEEDESIAK